MNKREHTYNIKLDWQIRLIVLILAIGIILNAFMPLIAPKSALAQLSYGDRLEVEIISIPTVYHKSRKF